MYVARKMTTGGGQAAQTTRVADVDSALVHLRVDYYKQFVEFPAGKALSSNVVSVGGQLWRIDLYLGGIRPYHRHVSIFLRHLSRSSSYSSVKAIFEPFFLGRDGRPSPKITKWSHVCEYNECSSIRSGGHDGYAFGADDLGYPEFYERAVVHRYMIGGNVTFVCAIVVVNELDPVPVPPSNLGGHLGRLLEDNGTTDVSFVVRGETFHAHRAILAARSPVFKAQLFGSMFSTSAPIVLHDISPAMFRVILRFMYTDAWSGDDDSLPVEMFQDLLAAADRYALHRLKLMCARKLWENVVLKGRWRGGESVTTPHTTTVEDVDSALVHFRVDYKQFMGFPPGVALHSDVVSIGGQLWMIDLYPRGIRAPHSYTSIFLRHLTKSLSSRCTVKAIFEPFFLGRDGRPSRKITNWSHGNEYDESNDRRSNYDFCADEFGYPEFFKRHALETYVVNGYVTFLCSVVVINELGSDPVPTSDLGDHLGRLLEDGSSTRDGMMMTTDVSFIVEGERFHAHRVVLGARSPVFKALLFGSMMEATTTSSAPIALHEITPATFGAMLRFMYTDAWPEGDEHVGDSSSIEMFQDLLAAADRYALDRLKLMCARKLWDIVSAHTVVSILVCAETYDCPELRRKCLDFCARKENFKQVASTDGYALSVLNFPSIIGGLTEHKVGASS